LLQKIQGFLDFSRISRILLTHFSLHAGADPLEVKWDCMNPLSGQQFFMGILARKLELLCNCTRGDESEVKCHRQCFKKVRHMFGICTTVKRNLDLTPFNEY
jgi:hypothetical protein